MSKSQIPSKLSAIKAKRVEMGWGKSFTRKSSEGKSELWPKIWGKRASQAVTSARKKDPRRNDYGVRTKGMTRFRWLKKVRGIRERKSNYVRQNALTGSLEAGKAEQECTTQAMIHTPPSVFWISFNSGISGWRREPWNTVNTLKLPLSCFKISNKYRWQNGTSIYQMH